ncbi:hypothetical protein E2C01_035444 [Portunus trituberculatus]|uniref:Uncharacterized protein n=1 Tax=Portunus trituberculatus TaxID=210409 RepID=A0A5B7F963_PORTR|nr:hypothetical protein [Portunus trituberculatus]
MTDTKVFASHLTAQHSTPHHTSPHLTVHITTPHHTYITSPPLTKTLTTPALRLLSKTHLNTYTPACHTTPWGEWHTNTTPLEASVFKEEITVCISCSFKQHCGLISYTSEARVAWRPDRHLQTPPTHRQVGRLQLPPGRGGLHTGHRTPGCCGWQLTDRHSCCCASIMTLSIWHAIILPPVPGPHWCPADEWIEPQLGPAPGPWYQPSLLGQGGLVGLLCGGSSLLAQQVAHLVAAAVTVGAQQVAAGGTLLLLTLSAGEQVLWSGWRGRWGPCGWGGAAGVVVLTGSPHQLPPLHSGLFLTLGAHQHIAASEATGTGQAGTLCPHVVLLAHRAAILGLAVAPPPPQLVQHAAKECCGASRGSADVWLVSRWGRGSPGVSVAHVHLQQTRQRLLQRLKRLHRQTCAIQVEAPQTLHR